MNSFVSYYIHHLFRPFEVYRRNLIFLKKVRWTEGVVLSWLFYAVMSFFNIGIFSILNSGVLNRVYGGKFLLDFNLQDTVRFLFILLVVKLITYPIWKILIVNFYQWIIQIFLKHKFNRSELAERAVVHSLVSDVYYLIPFLGSFVRDICSVVNFYSSLRYNAKLTIFESIFIIFSPMLFLFLLSLASFNFLMLCLFLIQ